MHVADESPVHENLLPGSEKLFLFFGGISGGIGMPPFEFYRTSKILNYSKIFFRDLNQSWYLRGLPTIGNNAYAIGKYLTDKIMESGATEISFVGSSMGGFAALLFCSMLKCGKSIVFSPQTFLSPEIREKYGDDRWAVEIEQLHSTRITSDIYDLKPWIQNNFPEIQADVYVSTSDMLDMQHANELADLPNISIHHFPDAGHLLVTKLRDDGVLAQILRS